MIRRSESGGLRVVRESGYMGKIALSKSSMIQSSRVLGVPGDHGQMQCLSNLRLILQK